jgi:hypothetical protein
MRLSECPLLKPTRTFTDCDGNPAYAILWCCGTHGVRWSRVNGGEFVPSHKFPYVRRTYRNSGSLRSLLPVALSGLPAGPARRPTLRDRERRFFRRTHSPRPGPQEHDTNSQNRLAQAWPLGRRRINDRAGPELTQNSVIHLNKRVSLRPAEDGLPSAGRADWPKTASVNTQIARQGAVGNAAAAAQLS